MFFIIFVLFILIEYESIAEDQASTLIIVELTKNHGEL